MKTRLCVIAFFVCLHSYAGNFSISGKIIKPLSDSIRFLYAPTSAIYHEVTNTVPVNSDGSFTVSFDAPDYYVMLYIRHGEQQTETFIKSGMALNMQLDASNFDSTLTYNGKGHEIGNFMAKHMLFDNGMGGVQGLYIKEADEFEKEVKGLEQNEMDFLKQYGADLPADFKEFYKIYYRYKLYAAINMYPPFHEMMKQQKMSISSVPAENYAVTEHVLAAFDDKYIDIESYRDFLNNYFSIQLGKVRNEDGSEAKKPSAELYISMAYKQMPPKTAQFYAARTIYMFSKSTPYNEVAKLCEEYKSLYPSSPYLADLDKVLANKKIIASGQKAIDFDIVTPEGKKMKLSDLKGKVVYIDFWSRGCAPCLAEMSPAKKIREYFKQKPVAFVYISLDADNEVWKKAIKDFKVEGINMHVDREWQSEVVQKYDVKGIPSYFLVDKEGKYASVEDLARPSDSKTLIAQIEKLLN